MSPKVKEILFDTFAVALILIGFSIHGLPSMCFLFVGLTCGSFALYHTLLNHRVHNVTKPIARNWSLLLWAISAIGVCAYWQQNKKNPDHPETFEYPFLFSLKTSEIADTDALRLTNNFLLITNFETPQKTLANVVMPIKAGATNIVLQLFVRNDSDAADGEFSIAIPQQWNGLANVGWVPVGPADNGDLIGMQIWAYKFFNFMKGDAMQLPDLQVSSLPPLGKGSAMEILGKGQNSTIECLGFNLAFVPLSTNWSFLRKPFASWDVPDSNGNVVISPQKLEELQK